ncbi:Nramp family divalent metal transporter [Pseudocolwellia agarivorans]|jgi:NRAMP (natural resistance-associated macrophage protein)-like metal ion transporter|uniref:Nramp family divalent metal transporter n=1 Tax=Pseudocolwellia agarivorans TaxID=1911682 RepID=UPI003F885335
MLINKIKNMGPGILVTAAFIGPGTITACTLAGANFGYTLLWALVFATLATIILQDMSARLGIVTQKGLGEVLLDALKTSIWKWPLIILIIIALYIGNAAYEAGNLAGAALGIEAITGQDQEVFKLAIGILSLLGIIILVKGSYKHIERILILLVLLMALSFILTFFVVQPDLLSIFKGMFTPSVPEGSLLTVIAIIGTTVVPYNLFLHASAAKSHWTNITELPTARTDTIISIGLGGLIAILVVSTAAASMFAHGITVNNASDMAQQFEPLFGTFSKYLLGIGMFAAGLSSVITAPLATSYAISEVLEIKGGVHSKTFKLISISIILVGASLAMTGIKPIEIIVLAQFANGLLLPVIASFLLYAMNHKKLLGKYSNTLTTNVLGGSVVIFTTLLGARMIARSLGWM